MRAVLLLAAVACFAIAACNATPLDDFVNLPDPAFSYQLVNSIRGSDLGIGYTTYFYNMTALTWLTPQDSSAYYWFHSVVITIPDNLNKAWDTAMVFITDGHVGQMMTAPDPIILGIALSAGSVGVEVHQIPVEPVYFYPEDKRRTEDAIIAYTWRHFLEHTDQPYWLLRMPMTKAVVKAMDLTTAEMAKKGLTINKFAVGGASKRGWTTWTVTAVDKRVVAAFPIVMPLVKMIENLNRHYQSFGGWSFALDDYLAENVTHYLNDPNFQAMADIIDPWTYRDRYTMPVVVTASSGDEFFIPDSVGLFLGDFGPNVHARILPNAEHSCAGHAGQLMMDIATFYHNVVLLKKPAPTYKWSIAADKSSITVVVDPNNKPTFIKVWRAHNHLKRDFRLLTGPSVEDINPIFWFETELVPQADGVTYVVETTKPQNGWEGYFVEMSYDIGGAAILGDHLIQLTTPIAVYPDVYPFPPCTTNC